MANGRWANGARCQPRCFAACAAAGALVILLTADSEAGASGAQSLRCKGTAVHSPLLRDAGGLTASARSVRCLGSSSPRLGAPNEEGVQCPKAFWILRGGGDGGGRPSRWTSERNPTGFRGGGRGSGGADDSPYNDADQNASNGYRRRAVDTRGPPDLMNSRPPPTAPGYLGRSRIKTAGPPDEAKSGRGYSFPSPYFSPRRRRPEPVPTENERTGRAENSFGSDYRGVTTGKARGRRGLMAVHYLVLSSFGLFSLNTILGADRVLKLSLDHARPRWWQLVTSLLLHGDQHHLMSNMFNLVIFGKMAEEDMGAAGMLLSFVTCGIVSSLVSLALMPHTAYSCGASGAVFGLFSVCVLGKMFNLDRNSFPEGRLRKFVEAAVFGWFVAESVMSEMRMVAAGGVRGTDHAAHFGGVFAGAVLILLTRRSISSGSSR